MANSLNVFKVLEKRLGRYSQNKNWLNWDCPFCGAKGRFGVHTYTGNSYCFKCEYRGSLPGLLRALGLAPDLAGRLLDRRASRLREEARKAARKDISLQPIDMSDFHEFTDDPKSIRDRVDEKLVEYGHRRGAFAFGLRVGTFGHVSLLGYLVMIYTMNGVPVYWQGRNVMAAGPKSQNPPEGVGWPRGSVLAHYDIIPKNRSVVLVEGPYDGVGLSASERFCPNPLLGKTDLSRSQLQLLASLDPVEVVCLLDPGTRAETARLYDTLEAYGFRTRAVLLEGEADPGDLGFEVEEIVAREAQEISRRDRLRWRTLESRRKSARRKQETSRRFGRF